MKKSVEERLSQHDREIAAIRKLMMQGMKMLVRSEKRIDNLTIAVVKLERRVDDLTSAVAKLEKNIDRLVRSLEHGGRNGHKPKPN